ncbi:MAG: serine protease [Candidatus Eremiobacteraeota bacterium]|nr:serine protease [Candidatus Eremiobacteraeota bacterium]
MTAASNALVELSSELARAVATIAPSVVYVDAHPRRDASGIVWDEHHVVTVDHAIEREDDIELLLGNGTSVRATLAGRDPSTDLALLHVDATLQAAPRADLATLGVGHLVLAVARDEDGATAASFGIVGSFDGPWRTWRGGEVDRFLRPDCNVAPSFSGGPLVDATGRVAGMNTWGLSRRTALTLPVDTIARVVARLQSGGGRIARAYLGIAMQAVGLPDALRTARGIAQRSGAIVMDVAAAGPAERAGVQIGDVILAFGAQTIEDSEDVQRALGAAKPGTTERLSLLRGGAPHAVDVVVGERGRDDD